MTMPRAWWRLCFVSQPYVIEDDQVIFSDDLRRHQRRMRVPGRWGDVRLPAVCDGSPTINDRMQDALNGGNDPIGEFMASLVDDPEARLFHTDMATYTALKERNLVTGVMFGATPGSDRAKWLEERLGRPNDSFWDKEVSDAGLADPAEKRLSDALGRSGRTATRSTENPSVWEIVGLKQTGWHVKPWRRYRCRCHGEGDSSREPAFLVQLYCLGFVVG